MIEAYLANNPIANVKWEAFIDGVIQLKMDDIEAMTAPELSIFIYMMNKRNENKVQLYSNLLGGG